MSVELIGVGATARAAWIRVLSSDPTARISQTPEWMDCITESAQWTDATRAYRTGDGRELVLPLARRRGAAASVASMPHGWGIGGLVCPGGAASVQEVAEVVADLTAQHALVVSVRPSDAAEPVWSRAVPPGVVRVPHMSQTVDLSGGFEVVWRDRFASTVRSHCRKAERRGVTAERDDSGRLIGIFDALYRKSVSRWAGQQHEPEWLAQWRARRRDPASKFETVARRLGPKCRVWVAWRGGEPIAAMVVLVHGEHGTFWRAAMDKEAVTGTGANELLHKLAIEEACAAGQRLFHLGESAPNSALARNKRGFGATEASHTSYRFERLPLTAADRFVRRNVKRVIGFRD